MEYDGLLRRAALFLEDEKWDQVDEYCEKVLDIEPECAQAYLYKLMSEMHVKSEEELRNCENTIADSDNYVKACRFDSEIQKRLEEYNTYISERKETANKDEIYDEATGLLSKGESLDHALDLLISIKGWKDSDDKISECQNKIEENKIANKKKKAKTFKTCAIIVPILVVAIILVLNFLPVTCKFCGGICKFNCGECENGHVECENCSGRGTICDNCDSTGKITCKSCKGSGKTKEVEWQDCSNSKCSGGKIYTHSDGSSLGNAVARFSSGSKGSYTTCSTCNGKGGRYVNKDCSDCEGTGKVNCPTCEGKCDTSSCTECGGKGYNTCNYCNGTTVIICDGCGGKGKTSIINNFSVKVETVE